jgi:hypothetical protein
MTLNPFRQAVLRQPFQPFELILADGRTFVIEHPEFAAVSPNGREVTFYEMDGTQHFLEALLIAEIRPVSPRVTAKGE